MVLARKKNYNRLPQGSSVSAQKFQDYRLILEVIGLVVIVVLAYNRFGGGELVGQAYVGDVQGCGNGVIDEGEQCDGRALAGQTCGGFGFAGGALQCSSSCQFDTLRCSMCGNGVVNRGEQCDGAVNKACSTLNLGAGQLGCTRYCLYDVRGCSG